MIKVYTFETWDENSGNYVTAPRKGTVQRIEHTNGIILQGSEEEVPVELVDQFGEYSPLKTA
jgi:hypothetical protein